MVLSVAEGALSSFRHQSEVETFSSAFLLGPFERGDFHTLAETFAGVHHYVLERKLPTAEKEPDHLSPWEAYRRALHTLVDGIAPEHRECSERVAQELLSRTEPVEYRSGA